MFAIEKNSNFISSTSVVLRFNPVAFLARSYCWDPYN
jgi:hypothetical protein